jgi:hypothetical protein
VEECIVGLAGGEDVPHVTYCSASYAVRAADGRAWVRGDLVRTDFMADEIRPAAGKYA